ncbi:hypothetical protein GCM10008024_40100 [Allgaiera indica]|uniref:Uncharacterized protein n=1 Tax=Allgaiera indica TaxID=765699 RepID=A0AAN4UWF0_9RHOB|nr:hypothetical protein [Allgaiera indica]GHE06271.1 hypothetical protein GCM10008024_40100 [Allgaiera indica]SDX89702.1 hypothetical protein SAMN05444006_13911 [Allgaiera indica]
MPEAERDPHVNDKAQRDPALRIVLAELELISRLLPVRGQTADAAAEADAGDTDEDLFDNMPV